MQTTESLRRDAALGSDLPSFIGLENSTTLTWNPIPTGGNWDGFKLIINDVLSLSTSNDTTSYQFDDVDQNIPYFARLAYSKSSQC